MFSAQMFFSALTFPWLQLLCFRASLSSAIFRSRQFPSKADILEVRCPALCHATECRTRQYYSEEFFYNSADKLLKCCFHSGKDKTMSRVHADMLLLKRIRNKHLVTSEESGKITSAQTKSLDWLMFLDDPLIGFSWQLWLPTNCSGISGMNRSDETVK